MNWKSIKIETKHDRHMYADWLEEQGESKLLIDMIRRSVDWKAEIVTLADYYEFIFQRGIQWECILWPKANEVSVELFYKRPTECFMIDNNGFSRSNNKNWSWLLDYLKNWQKPYDYILLR